MSSVDMLYKGLLPSYFGDTVSRLVVGSLIGLALGIPFGLLLGINRVVAAMFYPIMNFFQSVSGIAICWYSKSITPLTAQIIHQKRSG